MGECGVPLPGGGGFSRRQTVPVPRQEGGGLAWSARLTLGGAARKPLATCEAQPPRCGTAARRRHGQRHRDDGSADGEVVSLLLLLAMSGKQDTWPGGGGQGIAVGSGRAGARHLTVCLPDSHHAAHSHCINYVWRRCWRGTRPPEDSHKSLHSR
ncbi:hypothetical protein E2C01_067229 [Portunus trituberculatus]|uniref:Uncharacterized protein n=1 Tax=Portunus trituberculatus TaxID=210409 RepID=A0A5B7HT74_PORTR|nr:hypothetical protein [Portunus trituberculatus]